MKTRQISTSPAVNGGKRRLLIVASTLHVGGAERVIACLAKHVDRRKFDVLVCYLKQNGVVGEEMTREGISVLPLPGRDYTKHDRLTFMKLARLVREQRIDVMHTHDMHGFMDASACRLLMRSVRHVHTFHFGNYPHREKRYRQIEKLLWRIPDALVAVGHEQGRSIRDLYRIPEARMKVLWNGVETPRARVSERVIEAAGDRSVPVIGSISTLIPQKGLEHLLAAAAELKRRGVRFRLVMVGDGALRESLIQLAQTLRLAEEVRFTGWVPEASDCALPVCDIFVQSSLWEAMSMVVLEAAAAAKPMAITRVGENARVIEDGATGLLVPPADPVALADALERLICDPALAHRLGTAARARYEQQFTIDRMVCRYEDLYTSLVKAPQGA